MLRTMDGATLAHYLRPRSGEQRLGQTLQLPISAPIDQQLRHAQQHGARYVLLGVPEDLGPRANLGRGGAERGWPAFLQHFLNLPATPDCDGSDLLLWGEVALADLRQQAAPLDPAKPKQLDQLRELVTQLDRRLSPLIAAIVQAGLEPIVIGGGHNNALPILQGCSQALGQPMAAVNLDPHCDFRACEGRHSGNPFRYAWQQGALSHYQILGLHEQRNNADALAELKQSGIFWYDFQQIWLHREMSLNAALQLIRSRLPTAQPVGLELDLDAIESAPSSAQSIIGVPVRDACHALYRLAQHHAVTYLHLAEAAPGCHPAGLSQGEREIGQLLSELVLCYRDGRQHPCH
ncbi:formimidoylglutamase [Ferrimonas pelagia]|uniref:Formimidoylglutamase n=1 Tax=Ferrimonas pelagia TaxID=1177826 RepID=A0ABP9F5N6_9GAMM